MNFLTKIFSSSAKRKIAFTKPFIKKINDLEETMQSLSDLELKELRSGYISRHKSGESLDELLPEAFSATREVSRRQLGLRHFDSQLIGGIALHKCQIAEMATGEGKTLVATLPVYLNSITERKVVLVTVNDYLAKRDAEWMKPIYAGLDMNVSYIVSGQSMEERKEAYEADIIYATNNELGFDFLRNNLALSSEDRVMTDTFFAIVDEVDSILIDEARTPLVISGAAEDTSKLFKQISTFLPKLEEKKLDEETKEVVKDGHFVIDEKSRQVELTDKGHDLVEEILQDRGMIEGNQSLYSTANLKLLHYIQSALRARFLFKKDIDYMVQGDQVVLIDENTGRAMPGRRLGDGLHQALEEKERVPIQVESQTLASCTFQNYFRQYEKLAGMTGTAITEAQEFAEIYHLPVLEIPTNKEMVRKDENDIVFLTQSEKYDAVVEEILEKKEKGQPVLVGTASLESSELLSSMLKNKDITHQVLNAKNHAKEAEIIAQAGKPGVVTIATNMAGRGTDIVLGGNLEAELVEISDSDPSRREQIEGEWKKRNEKVIQVGGLHVIGTERNESRRIDNQLRGRSGRQGDPGSSRFYISIDDSLMRIFASDQFKNIMQGLGLENGEAIEHRMLSGAIERAQKRVEGRNFDIRKLLLEYDDMANEQRQIIYSQRDSILDSEDITELLDSMRISVVEREVDLFIPYEAPEIQWDVQGLESSIETSFGVKISIQKDLDSNKSLKREDVIEKINSSLQIYYSEKGIKLGPLMRDFEKQIVLQVIDNAWKEHLGAVEYLRQGIGLRGYASKNPKLEFRRESFELFENLLESIRVEAIKFLMRVEIQINDEHPQRTNRQEIKAEQKDLSSFEPNKQNTQNQEQLSGNRRQRRQEAKMARKRDKTKR
ncbi:MAG: preprotein translocase subunit SecA [Gammaproteobacteria bacterium]